MAKGGFYAVKTGRVPGVYTTWDECKEQVNGFPGAEYQKFKTEDEANVYVGLQVDNAGAAPVVEPEPVQVAASQSQQNVSQKAGAYYAVRVGKTPGVYHTWDECKAQIEGVAGAKYRKFKSEEMAMAFMDGQELPKAEAKPATQKKAVPNVEIPDGPYAFVDGSFNPETGVYGFGGFVNVLGRKYPVYGSDCDPEMASMRNVAGEISGAIAAVKKAEELHIRDLTILYDYRGIEEWASGGWKANKQGTRDYAEFMSADNRLVNVKFQKVPAHTGIEGNEMADVMAKNSVGIRLTGPQQKLLEKALTCGRRDGVLGVDVADSMQASEGFDFE